MTKPSGPLARRWEVYAVAVYGVLLGLLMARHEPWRDEIQAWLLARDSPHLLDLWRHTRYEGHPLLWHVLLWGLAKLTPNPAAMQVLHWVLATAAAGLFIRVAPLPPWLRGAWVFSYFPLYEYGAIARNYGLTALFLYLAVALRHRPALALTALGGASHSSPMGILLAPPLAWALARRGLRATWGWALLAVAWGLAVFCCLPPPDYEHARGVFLAWDGFRANYVLRGLAAAVLPLFRPGLHFWNDPWLFPWPGQGPPWAQVVALMVVLLAVVTVAVALTKPLRLPFFWGVAVLVVFFYVKFPGITRHHGFFFLWLVMASWLGFESSARKSLLCALLVTHTAAALVGAATAAFYDWRYPFSPGRQLAAQARSLCAHLPLVGHPDWAASTVAGYLPGVPLYYPGRGAWGTFVVWDLARAQGERLGEDEVLERAALVTKGAPFCLLVNRPLATPQPCTLLAAHPTAIVADETLWLYRCEAPLLP